MRLVAMRVALLVALTLSTCLFTDAVRTVPAFCSLTSHCETAIRSGIGRIAGIPLPAVGMSAFGTVLVFSLSSRLRIRRLGRQLTICGGVCGAGLIVVQLVGSSRVCPWCLAVDLLAALAALAAFDARSTQPDLSSDARRWWIVALQCAYAAPLLWGGLVPDSAVVAPEIPAELKAYWVPGKVNVIEITSFECPYCREMHPVIAQAVAAAPAVNHVRIMLPHADGTTSWSNALAMICAEESGETNALATELFRAGSSNSPESRNITAGLSDPSFHACLIDPDTHERLRRRIASARVGLVGLPTVYIQNKAFVGTFPPEVIKTEIERAVEKRHSVDQR